MTITLLLLIIVSYLLLSFLLYHVGRSRKIGGVRVLIISLLLTPVIGFVVCCVSPNRMVSLEKRYLCPECNYEFTEMHDHCPYCEASGKHISLKAVDRNMV